MKYSLDTNSCIQYITGRSQGVRERISGILPDELIVCDIVRAELYYGAEKSQNPKRSHQKAEDFLIHYKTLPFNTQAARIFGRIRASLEAKGTPIGAYDLQIAAIAIVHDLILVTHNTKEFSRIPELRLEDWE